MTGAVIATIGSAGFRGQVNTYTTGSGVDTVPPGAIFVVIEAWGGGGSGAAGTGSGCTANNGQGAGAAGYSRSSPIACIVGQTIAYSVGPGGVPSGVTGTASTVSSGTLVVPTQTANGGGGGNNGTGQGLGGTASGGAVNTTGANSISSQNGANGTVGLNGQFAGSGGSGGIPGVGHPGSAGAAGQVSFNYS